MTSENEFVRQLKQRFPIRDPVDVGIGDDGAVLHHPPGDNLVVVTDMLLDGVHFNLKNTDVRLAGRKAVAVNLSDLAAMACLPTAAFVSIAIPTEIRTDSVGFLHDLYSGIEELITQYEFSLAGGDTNIWRGPFAINVCLTGTPMGGRAILRSGARPGDTLFVTGPLGGSLTHGRHLTFSPRLDAAQWLVSHVNVNAMMDLSDGLSMDLHRMMEASQTAAVLRESSIPIHGDVSETLSASHRLAAALGDGEDFELLVSVPHPDAATLTEKARRAGLALFEVGTVIEGAKSLIQDKSGEVHELPVTGWEHHM